MEALVYLVLLGGYAYIVYWTSMKAKERGRNQTNWIILSVLFSFFATIALFMLPDLSKTPAAAVSPTGAATPPPTPVANAIPAAPAPTVAPTPAAPPPPPAVAAPNPVPPPPATPAPQTDVAPASEPSAASAEDEDERRPCPRCGESIAVAAKVCRFCGLDLTAPSQGS